MKDGCVIPVWLEIGLNPLSFSLRVMLASRERAPGLLNLATQSPTMHTSMPSQTRMGWKRKLTIRGRMLPLALHLLQIAAGNNTMVLHSVRAAIPSMTTTTRRTSLTGMDFFVIALMRAMRRSVRPLMLVTVFPIPTALIYLAPPRLLKPWRIPQRFAASYYDWPSHLGGKSAHYARDTCGYPAMRLSTACAMTPSPPGPVSRQSPEP